MNDIATPEGEISSDTVSDFSSLPALVRAEIDVQIATSLTDVDFRRDDGTDIAIRLGADGDLAAVGDEQLLSGHLSVLLEEVEKGDVTIEAALTRFTDHQRRPSSGQAGFGRIGLFARLIAWSDVAAKRQSVCVRQIGTPGRARTNTP